LKKAELLAVGRVERSHGREGDLKVKLFPEFVADGFFLRFF
jgi:ribosomal 30S subunit maturation factor RimM